MRRFLGVLVAATILASACTSDDGGGGGDARPGGILRIGVTADSSLDPAQARTVEQLLVADQLFDGLTAFDVEKGEVTPSLAIDWTVSDDGKLWEFTLAADRSFSNGRKITANDVKYTLDRIARRGSASPASELLEQVVGYADSAIRDVAGLVGVVAVAENAVRIALSTPFAELPAVLSSPVFGVVPSEAVEAASPAFGRVPVSSGPFTIRDRSTTRIRLVRSPGSKALVAGIDLIGFDGVPASYTAFTNGELDWSQVPPDQVAAANRRYGDDGFVPYAAELFYGINMKNPKFADVRFREAIVRAIDRRSLVRAVYDDIYRPLDGIVVSGVPGSQTNACGDVCAHNVAKAKELVTAVYPEGPPEIFLDYDAGPIRDALAKAIQADLKEAGINATLRSKPPDEYLSFEVSGEQELFVLGWIALYPAQEAFLGPLFASGSRNNLVAFSHPPFDAALAGARAEPGDERRAELYRDAERIALSQVPVMPILQYIVHSVSASRVRDLNLSPIGTFDSAKVWLAS